MVMALQRDITEPSRKAEVSTSERISIDQERINFESRAWDFQTIMAIIAHLFSFVLPAALLLTINADIGPSKNISWVATAWTLSGAVLETIAGNCSDIFGRRNFIIGGNFITLIGCIVGARATSVTMLIAAMALMGIGGAPQNLAFACTNEIVPKKSRGTTLASLNLVALPGSAFGSVIAYALVAHLNWRWAFYLGIISNGLAFISTFVFYWPPGFLNLHPDGKSRFQQFKELDFIGLLLFGGGLTSFLLGLSFGGNPYKWTSAAVLAPLIIGVIALFGALPLWEIYAPETISKLCPPSLFKTVRGFTFPIVVVFVSGMMLISLQVFWPQEVQLLFTTVPTTVGWYSLAYNTSATVGGFVAGSLFARIRRTRIQLIVIVIIQFSFTAAMASITQHTPARAIAFTSVAAFCVGASSIYGVLFVQFGAKDRQIGVATGLLGSVRTTGGSIALAIFTSILHQQVNDNLAKTVSAAAIKAGLDPSAVPSLLKAMLAGSAQAIQAVNGVTPAILGASDAAVKDVYSGAFRMIYLVNIVFGGLAVLVAIFVRSVDDALTHQIAVKLNKPHILPGHQGRNSSNLHDQKIVDEEK